MDISLHVSASETPTAAKALQVVRTVEEGAPVPSHQHSPSRLVTLFCHNTKNGSRTLSFLSLMLF